MNDDNKNINKQILSDIVNNIVDQAILYKKSITIEEISLKRVLKNKKISAVCYNLFISLLRSRCVKNGVCLYEVNPAYTSVISRLKYAKRYGRSAHATAAMVIGRRGLGFVEKIPSVYIGLLQREERSQSLLMQWNLINKRLLKVKKSESGLKNLVSDQSSCSPTPSVSQRWVEQ